MADANFAGKRSRTHATDGVVNYFKFAIGASGAVGTITEWGGADVVSGVVRTAEGIYTVTLQKPYPSALVFVNPVLSLASADSVGLRASYDSGTYSATAGTFVINTADIDALSGDAETPAFSAADPENGAEIMVHLAYVE